MRHGETPIEGKFDQDEVAAAHGTLQEVIRISEDDERKEVVRVELTRHYLDNVRQAIQRAIARREDRTFNFLKLVDREQARLSDEMNLHGRDPAAMIWRRLQWLAHEGMFAGQSDREPEIEPVEKGRYRLTERFRRPGG